MGVEGFKEGRGGVQGWQKIQHKTNIILKTTKFNSLKANKMLKEY